ncbi:MAG: exonuclease domain-containing protein [Oscillospiraceae bacterium]|nr:exonuclease domain-containing protein [Oscillospiraceae bacterium]
MTYIIIDLEWNQARSMRDVVVDDDGNKLYGEIIQIGAVRLSDDLTIADELKLNVRPKYYKVIHRKVRQITGINQEDLAHGEEFRSAMEKLRSWCGDDFAFLTWGPDDIRILRRNIEIYGDDSSWIDTWFNLQTIYNMQTDSGDNQKSLATALEHFGLTPEEPLHDALNDAYYTALVAEKLDLARGISDLVHAERLRMIMDESKPLLCEVYAGYKTRREIFKDMEASAVKCPECHGKCKTLKWVTEKNDRYVTLASCEEHGEFVARITVSKADAVYNATKVVYAAGGGAKTFYEKRVKKEEAKKKHRKRRPKSAAPRKKTVSVEKV